MKAMMTAADVREGNFFRMMEARYPMEIAQEEGRRRVRRWERRYRARKKLARVALRTFGIIVLMGALLATGMVDGRLYWIVTIIGLAVGAFDAGRLQRDLY